MDEIEIEINADGSFLVPRGDKESNAVWINLLNDISDEKKAEIVNFLSTSQDEIIYSDLPNSLCG